MLTPQTKNQPARIRTQLLVLAISRFFLVIASRMIFSFLPKFARGLGVSEAKLQASLSSRLLVTFIVPFLIPLSEKFGRKTFLYLAMLVFTLACILAAVAQSLPLFVLALLILSLSQSLYDPTMRAHLGDIVPYAQRGKAVAVTEFSWSGGLLIGAPVAGLLITKYGWHSPFIWLSVLGFVSIGLLWRVIPKIDSTTERSVTLRQAIKLARGMPAFWGASLYVGAIMFANIFIFASYAGWMERQFDVSVGGLGAAAMVIGSAEFLGELLAGWSSDRFGKRRMVLLSSSTSILFYIALPYAGQSLGLAAVLLFVLFVAFEMSFICVVPIFTELLPEARSVPLAVLAITPPLARSIGLLLVGTVTLWGGFHWVGLAAGIVTLLGVLVFGRFVPE